MDLENGETLFPSRQRWHSLLLKQWHHFEESGDGVCECERIVGGAGLPRKLQPKRSEQKWVGLRSSCNCDCRYWRCKYEYWLFRVKQTSPCDESRALWQSCHQFYGSIQNEFLA